MKSNAAQDYSRSEPSPWRILIVDDNQDAADLMGYFLKTMGYATAVAYDGFQALEVARSFLPAVALVDIGLPGMDGCELARRLRGVPGLSSLRLVAITGHAHDTIRSLTRAAGFVTHLVKPLDLDDIARVSAR